MKQPGTRNANDRIPKHFLEHRFLGVCCARRRSPQLARDARAPPRPAPARSHSLDANPVLVATGTPSPSSDTPSWSWDECRTTRSAWWGEDFPCAPGCLGAAADVSVGVDVEVDGDGDVDLGDGSATCPQPIGGEAMECAASLDVLKLKSSSRRNPTARGFACWKLSSPC